MYNRIRFYIKLYKIKNKYNKILAFKNSNKNPINDKLFNLISNKKVKAN